MIGTIVIIGASAAGVAAAMTLRDEGHIGDIVLIGAEEQLPYDRPAVSKELLLAGTVPPILTADRYAELRIDLRLGVTVTAIDLTGGRVLLGEDESITFDRLLVATGGKPRHLPVPGAELDGLHYVRDARDGLAIHTGLRPGMRVAVIGGGLIGAEVAASAAQAGCEVDWIEAEDRCLARVLPAPLADAMMAVHRGHGVRIHSNAAVVRLHGDTAVEAVELHDGRQIAVDIVVVGIGIVPETALAEAAGLAVDNGILVDPFCATSAPGVYAAGDVARHQSRYMPVAGRLEHWRNAQQQGAAAARAMLGRGEPYHELPWFWTDQYTHHLEGCGLARPGDEAVLRGDPASGSATVFHLRDGALVAAVTLNRANDVRGAMRLIERGVTPSHDVLSDPTQDLRKLGKERVRGAA